MKSNQLSARKVESATEPGYYGDGGGLYLQVSKKYASRNWVFRFMLNGRARRDGSRFTTDLHAKGGIREERARKCRQLVADGIDPIEERRRLRDETRADDAGRMLFKDAVAKFLDVHQATWKNAKHRQQWANTLRDYAKPLRDRPIAAIDGAQISPRRFHRFGRRSPRQREGLSSASKKRVCQWVKDGMPLR